MRRLLPVVLAAVALAAAPAAASPPSFADGDGLHVVGARQVDARLWDVTVRTAALAQPVDVDVLLPAGYDQAARTRYPVLYLFHGTSGRASDWTRMGDAEGATAGLPLIVVMPDAGYDGDGGGWCTDWVGGEEPRWEDFHVGELIPWVDGTLRTVAARRGRAVYGLSQGGFCSMSYAARHPDLFAAAGAYSGAVDTSGDPLAETLVTPIVQGTALGLDGQPPDAMFGSRLTDEINWRAHDPTTLAPNLRGMDIRLYTGNGRPGPLDAGLPNPGAMAIEAGVHELTVRFHARLEDLGIPSAYRDYGPGTHSWPYWARDLRDTVGPLMRVFADPPRRPRPLAYRSGETHWSAWGYDVTYHRPKRELATLEDATRHGFALTGHGSATVLTPGVYRPGRAFAVRTTSAHGETTATVRAGADRRLALEVPLAGDGATRVTISASARASSRRGRSSAPRGCRRGRPRC